MERDQAVAIAEQFAKHFPAITGEALKLGNDWALRIVHPHSWVATATTRDQAAHLWKDLELTGVLHT